MLLFLFLSLGAASPSQTTTQSGPVAVSQDFPTFGGYTLAGEYLSLGALLDTNQTIIVSYFATWCAPCREGLPVIEALAKKDSNVTAVYIALGEKDTGKVKQFAEEVGLQSPIILDRFQKIGERHGMAGEGVRTVLPRTFVLDQKGTVQTIFIEEGDDFDQRLRSAVDKVK